MRYMKQQSEGREILVGADQTSNVSSLSAGFIARKLGYVKGTTEKSKLEINQLRIDLTNEITDEYKRLMMEGINMS